MDTHLNPALNPAHQQYTAWSTLLRYYNPDLDGIIERRQTAQGGSINWNCGSYFDGNRLQAPRLAPNLFLWPDTTSCFKGAVGLHVGNPNTRSRYWQAGTAYMIVDSVGRFRFPLPNYRYAWQALSHHTFIFQQSIRGDLIFIRPQGPHLWSNFSPWDVQKRHPYVILPRWSGGDIIGADVWYELEQDARGHWRLRVSQTQGPEAHGTYSLWRDRLEQAYARTDRLYRLRRKKKFAEAGLRDPETTPALPAIIMQNPDALAKAFVTQTPAPVVFPKRQALEAVSG